MDILYFTCPPEQLINSRFSNSGMHIIFLEILHNSKKSYFESNVRWYGFNKSQLPLHDCDVIMGAISSQITSLTIVYSTVYLDADQRKHQSSATLGFLWGIHRGPMNCPHKWPVTRNMFPFDDVIMKRCDETGVKWLAHFPGDDNIYIWLWNGIVLYKTRQNITVSKSEVLHHEAHLTLTL